MTDQSSAPSAAPNLPARRFAGSFGGTATSTPVFALEEASYRFLEAYPTRTYPEPVCCPTCGEMRSEVDRATVLQESLQRARQNAERFTLAWLDAHRPHGGCARDIALDCAHWLAQQGLPKGEATVPDIVGALESLEQSGLVKIARRSIMPELGLIGAGLIRARLCIPRAELFARVPELALSQSSKGRQ